MEYERYALYYAPPQQSELAEFGNSWLGWNPETRQEVERPSLGKLTHGQIAEWTNTPSRYGFHGTLKPPFKLAEGKTPNQLEAAIAELAKQLPFMVCGPLQLKVIGHFLALVPTNCHNALSRLAGRCVRTLDDFRAPPSDAELARRRQTGLSLRQDELLMKWGYPYVMDEFRFHLTLTGKLEQQQVRSAQIALRGLVSTVLTSPFEINEICLFGDPGDGEPFHLINRYSLCF